MRGNLNFVLKKISSKRDQMTMKDTLPAGGQCPLERGLLLLWTDNPKAITHELIKKSVPLMN